MRASDLVIRGVQEDASAASGSWRGLPSLLGSSPLAPPGRLTDPSEGRQPSEKVTRDGELLAALESDGHGERPAETVYHRV